MAAWGASCLFAERNVWFRNCFSLKATEGFANGKSSNCTASFFHRPLPPLWPSGASAGPGTRGRARRASRATLGAALEKAGPAAGMQEGLAVPINLEDLVTHAVEEIACLTWRMLCSRVLAHGELVRFGLVRSPSQVFCGLWFGGAVMHGIDSKPLVPKTGCTWVGLQDSVNKCSSQSTWWLDVHIAWRNHSTSLSRYCTLR